MEFSSEDIVVVHTGQTPSNDSLTIQFYVMLPEGASNPEEAVTTHVLPSTTLEEVFIENGDIIRSYTLSSPLAAMNTQVNSPGGSKWLFGGAAAMITFGLFTLCLALVVYKWKHKKRQVTVTCDNINVHSLQYESWSIAE